MIGFEIKKLFFDRQAVTSRMDPAKRKVLSKFGAFVRRTAKGSIRRRKKPAPPESPPSSHTGLLKKFIFFGYLQEKLVGDANWIETEEVNDGGDEDLKVKHVGPHAPATVQTIGAAAEGAETAVGSSFVVGTGGNGLDFWVASRMGYFHAGDKKIYMYMRKLTVDETGHVRAISGETRVEVDACVEETV